MHTMPLLHIPDHRYRLLAAQAEREHRSLELHAVAVLVRGLEVGLDAKARRRNVLRVIKEWSPAKPVSSKDPAKLIREDRRR
jgi:hypothetical protein